MVKSKPKSRGALTSIKSKPDNIKTLVLDIDHTLIYTIKNTKRKKLKDKYTIYLRPHLFRFLSDANKNYKLVIWTGASKDYADYVIKYIKENGEMYFKERKENEKFEFDSVLTRDDLIKGKKDIKKINNKNGVILVDDHEDYAKDLKRYIKIYPYNGEEDDCSLAFLLGFLNFIKNSKKIGTELKKYSYVLEELKNFCSYKKWKKKTFRKKNFVFTQ